MVGELRLKLWGKKYPKPLTPVLCPAMTPEGSGGWWGAQGQRLSARRNPLRDGLTGVEQLASRQHVLEGLSWFSFWLELGST